MASMQHRPGNNRSSLRSGILAGSHEGGSDVGRHEPIDAGRCWIDNAKDPESSRGSPAVLSNTLAALIVAPIGKKVSEWVCHQASWRHPSDIKASIHVYTSGDQV